MTNSKFEKWCIRQNVKAGKEAKLTKEDKMMSSLFFKIIPKILMFILIVSLAMRSYGIYGIERTMIVMTWILIYTTSQNMASIRNKTNIIMQNQIKFFQSYDDKKEIEENISNSPLPKIEK
ncbi:hypothetical protein GQ473_04920 [archaeon]|nr:hypothetical protein [archaeon]